MRRAGDFCAQPFKQRFAVGEAAFELGIEGEATPGADVGSFRHAQVHDVASADPRGRKPRFGSITFQFFASGFIGVEHAVAGQAVGFVQGQFHRK